MESKNVQPHSESEYRDVIQHDFPGLHINTIKIVGSGEDRAAVLVNDSILFRLPRHIHGTADVDDVLSTERETGLLKTLELPFNVPRPSHVAPDKRYFGYPFLTGRRWADVLGKQTPSDELIRDWVRVRKAVSKAITLSRAEQLGVPRLDLDRHVADIRRLIKDEMHHDVRNGLQSDLDYLTAYVSQEVWEFTHNDLNAENILVNDSADKITAVLDFGDAHIAPRSSDYYLWDKYPHEVIERVSQIAHEENDDFDTRIARALHRVYVAVNIMEHRRAEQSKDAEQGYWLELERYYEINSDNNLRE